jgi:hypothetical protein
MYIFRTTECDVTLCFSYKHILNIPSNMVFMMMMMRRRRRIGRTHGAGYNTTSRPESNWCDSEGPAQEF